MTNEYSILRYWRNSLADAERMAIDTQKFKSAIAIPMEQIQIGQISQDLTIELSNKQIGDKSPISKPTYATEQTTLDVLVFPLTVTGIFENGVPAA
jgi:hypothetical protein